ncbi:hypothetical protein CEXT_561881 [Caerostris extrusa]|uniref:Uncharacterized protein n=1 Tax=Caerostris extrusa TaxID=172846 RepID=A0AAV4XPK0_CAEEX|nr:hypothetical protein CEXT_561881 [Caerostris extrusa]
MLMQYTFPHVKVTNADAIDIPSCKVTNADAIDIPSCKVTNADAIDILHSDEPQWNRNEAKTARNHPTSAGPLRDRMKGLLLTWNPPSRTGR